MKKDNEVRPRKTRCDVCGKLATVLIGDVAYCARCSRGPRPSLRNCAVELANQYK